MRWIALLLFGMLGWAGACGAVSIRIILAPWMHEWQGLVVCAVAVAAAFCAGLAVLPLFEPCCVIFGDWIENLAADAEAVSKRLCGKAKGWIYHAIKWAAILWFAPFLMMIGEILSAD